MDSSLKRKYINLLSILGVLTIFFINILSYNEFMHLKEQYANQSAPPYHATAIYIIGNSISSLLIILCIFFLNQQLNKRLRTEKKLRRSEQKLYQLAYYDSLTRLPNRALLLKQLADRLAIIKSKNENIALLSIDIDNFKTINDSMGYEIGNQILIVFSNHLKSLLRTNDIVARLGDDEFIVVLNEVENIKEIELIARKILTSLASSFLIEDHKTFLTISIGVSVYPNNGVDATALLKNADIALYQAKIMGKNNYQFCTHEMTIAVEKGALLDYQLHQAVLHDEFVLLYQPKISLGDGKISGVEALMRWNRPNVGFINPTEFISLAESNGLIVPISEWMIRTVCLQGKKWHAQGFPPCAIAINISIQQFNTNTFIGTVKKILDEIQFNPEYLEIEITESFLMKNSVDTIATLRALKEMGIKITIDDFGTGYSALSYLQAFTIDKLKIDKSFIDEITTTNHNPSIINAIIVMAHSLGIKVVAEGVETAMQLDFLKQYHCDEAQGFYYSRPLAADDISAFFAKHR